MSNIYITGGSDSTWKVFASDAFSQNGIKLCTEGEYPVDVLFRRTDINGSVVYDDKTCADQKELLSCLNYIGECRFTLEQVWDFDIDNIKEPVIIDLFNKAYLRRAEIAQAEMEAAFSDPEPNVSEDKKTQSLSNLLSSAAARSTTPQSDTFVFSPSDYETAKAALLSSGNQHMPWNNSGYACRLEAGDSDDIYYDLHLTTSGTTIMYGEVVELVRAENDIVHIRVPNDEHECASLNKAFFEKNFVRDQERSFSKSIPHSEHDR